MADGIDDDEVVELRCGGGRDDPGAYAAELKRKFDLYCAAVAKSMDAKSQESSFGYSNSQASGTSELNFEASFDGDGDGASLLTNSNVIGHDDFQGKPANNARRSRKSRETHLSNLESQVSRLTSEDASLVKRLADMTLKYKYATLDNRNIIADVETMRTKVRSLQH
ncbi:unnamed protein product [Urochloa decumbens]|uniref:Uncharacterized protein n=1 Tax=Urochloa decumbens TaxID=240449 RepID=A0ABC9AUQ7_9POAL